jgi:hypothetical protein
MGEGSDILHQECELPELSSPARESGYISSIAASTKIMGVGCLGNNGSRRDKEG